MLRRGFPGIQNPYFVSSSYFGHRQVLWPMYRGVPYLCQLQTGLALFLKKSGGEGSILKAFPPFLLSHYCFYVSLHFSEKHVTLKSSMQRIPESHQQILINFVVKVEFWLRFLCHEAYLTKKKKRGQSMTY